MLRRLPLIALAGLALAAPAHAADPLGYEPGRDDEYERAAAYGHAHALYARSPGGVVATAERTAAFRPLAERARRGTAFSPDLLEAIVFLESAGRPDVIAGSDPAAAAGLAQILAETGRNFLGLRVDLAASRKLTREIAAARARGQGDRAQRLEARRRQVDERFAPRKALEAMARYLTTARGYLGRNDLAVASYHMGIGNLQNALRAYGAESVPYVQLFFDSAPDRNAAAWQVLVSMSDDSRHYYFKVLAARRIMHLYRTDRAQLEALARLHARKSSAEEVFHPPFSTRSYAGPDELAQAWDEGRVTRLPESPGLSYSPRMGELGRPRALYRGLRPEAAAALDYIGRRVRELSGAEQPLIVTSTLRDQTYQGALLRRNAMATPGYSLHTTGFAFDVARVYESKAQAAAFQFVLERLQARGLIAWIREPHAIHVTVAKGAGVLAGYEGAPEPAPAPVVEPDPLPDPLPRRDPVREPQPVKPPVEAQERPGLLRRFFATLGF